MQTWTQPKYEGGLQDRQPSMRVGNPAHPPDHEEQAEASPAPARAGAGRRAGTSPALSLGAVLGLVPAELPAGLVVPAGSALAAMSLGNPGHNPWVRVRHCRGKTFSRWCSSRWEHQAMALEWMLHAIDVSPTKPSIASQNQSGTWEKRKG